MERIHQYDLALLQSHGTLAQGTAVRYSRSRSVKFTDWQVNHSPSDCLGDALKLFADDSQAPCNAV